MDSDKVKLTKVDQNKSNDTSSFVIEKPIVSPRRSSYRKRKPSLEVSSFLFCYNFNSINVIFFILHCCCLSYLLNYFFFLDSAFYK